MSKRKKGDKQHTRTPTPADETSKSKVIDGSFKMFTEELKNDPNSHHRGDTGFTVFEQDDQEADLSSLSDDSEPPTPKRRASISIERVNIFNAFEEWKKPIKELQSNYGPELKDKDEKQLASKVSNFINDFFTTLFNPKRLTALVTHFNKLPQDSSSSIILSQDERLGKCFLDILQFYDKHGRLPEYKIKDLAAEDGKLVKTIYESYLSDEVKKGIKAISAEKLDEQDLVQQR